MQDVNVVIVFYSRTGLTEKLALAAAVGAVEGKANIRLRRIPETASEDAMAEVPGWKENHDRMSWESVAAREADWVWAEGLVVAIPEWMSVSAPEITSLLAMLTGGNGEIAAALGPKGLDKTLEAAGWNVIPPANDALLAGRDIAGEVRRVRALKL